LTSVCARGAAARAPRRASAGRPRRRPQTPLHLLLDDVFEKLDARRMHQLLERVCAPGNGQLFITDTHPERIREQLNKLAVDYSLIGLKL